MITNLHIENFKSLVNFDLPPKGNVLGNFTCLIGLNGAGKSTLLQAFDFLGQLAVGKMDEWLMQRDWRKSELVSCLGKRSPVISFELHFSFDGEPLVWKGRFNINQLKCTSESLERNGKILLDLNEGRLKLVKSDGSPLQIVDKLDAIFQGSVLSVFHFNGADSDIVRVKDTLRGLKSLELLAPHLLRRKARNANDIGLGGEKLSPFLAQLSSENKELLRSQLREFYPHVKMLQVKGYRAGWKGLRVWEDFSSQTPVDAAHLNDGMLRIIAILAQAYTAHSFLLFDEIENGINPELAEKLMDFLVALGSCGKQVIVTTHSPVILNFLEDDVASKGVILLYKTRNGQTRSCRYFDQPETSFKLKALGPGEVFVDTDLTKIVNRLDLESVCSEDNTGGIS